MTSSARIGVVWISTGGPRTPRQVESFIRQMLSDPMVMPLVWPLRSWLARRIARRRREQALERYLRMGLPSPVLASTERQGRALEGRLGEGFVVETAFSYAEPRARDAVERLGQRGANRILALAAFPQWSRSTSGSAVRAVELAARKAGLAFGQGPSFPQEEGFVEALADGARPHLGSDIALLFCAHGVPLSLVQAGDPYVREVESTVQAVARRLGEGRPRLAFQSRMGRLEWPRPYLEDSIAELGASGARSLLLLPVSFACENLETLVELDLEAAEMARAAGIEKFARAPTPGEHPAFVQEMAALVRREAARLGWSGEVES